jgi:predicted nucleic acid-binding protein
VRRIFWDTMVFAYWLEDHPIWGPRVEKLFAKMERRSDVLCSSSVVLGELLVGPLKTGDVAAADSIERYFQSGAVHLLPYPQKAGRTFAELRAGQGVKPLDALHLATAAASGVDAFITNDRRLKDVVVPGISFIAAIDSELF